MGGGAVSVHRRVITALILHEYIDCFSFEYVQWHSIQHFPKRVEQL